ncbi:O-antigen ligase family protein [Desulfobacterota bacterium M19]
MLKEILKNKVDYLLVFLLIIFSGNPALTGQPQFDAIIVLFAFFLLAYSIRRNKFVITPTFTKIVIIFSVILVVQTINFLFFPVRTILGFYVRLYIAFAVFSSVKNFSYVFVKIMVVLSVIALILHYLRITIGVDLPSLFQPLADIIDVSIVRRQATFFHTFFLDPKDKLRNAGMFWEPGAFAGYLILAIVLLSLIKNEIVKKEHVISLSILSAALLSTKSTMGYMCFPFALLLHLDFNREKVRSVISGKILLLSFIIIPFIVVISFYAYNNVKFIGEKFERKIAQTTSQKGNWQITRVGTFLFDLNYIKQRPLTGWGANPKTRFSLNPEMIGKHLGMGNGMSDFAVKYGLIGLFTFIFFIWKNFQYYYGNKYLSFLAVFTVILTLQGEAFLGYPLYIGLMFLNEGQKNTKIRRMITW